MMQINANLRDVHCRRAGKVSGDESTNDMRWGFDGMCDEHTVRCIPGMLRVSCSDIRQWRSNQAKPADKGAIWYTDMYHTWHQAVLQTDKYHIHRLFS